MQKPTEQEIKEASKSLYCSFTAFKSGVYWLLNWQKSQDLQSRCHCGEIEIEPHICPYKQDINNDSETLCNCCSVCRRNCAEDI